MRKSLKLSLIFLLILVIGFLLFRSLFIRYFFSFNDLSKEDSRVLIDSVKLNNDETLYWFKYGEITGSTSVSYMAIEKKACNISDKNAIIKGDLIYRIDTIRNDSIFVISRLGLQVIKTHSKYKFIDRKFSYDEHYKDKGLKKEVSITNICKQQ